MRVVDDGLEVEGHETPDLVLCLVSLLLQPKDTPSSFVCFKNRSSFELLPYSCFIISFVFFPSENARSSS